MYKILVSAIACSVLGSTAALAQGMTGSEATTGGAGHGSSQVHESMTSGMQEMQTMQPTGDVDKDFAAMMRIHHQQAVDMAKVELQHGKSAELKSMARKMIKDQRREIDQLDQWLASHK